MKKPCATCGESKEANRSKESGFAWRAERNTYYSNCKACLLIYNNNKAKERRRLIALKERETIGEDPHGHLAADIIVLAIRDLRKYGSLAEMPNLNHNKTPTDMAEASSMARKGGYVTIREELTAFFASGWFEELCDTAGVGAEYMRRHIDDMESPRTCTRTQRRIYIRDPRGLLY